MRESVPYLLEVCAELAEVADVVGVLLLQRRQRRPEFQET